MSCKVNVDQGGGDGGLVSAAEAEWPWHHGELDRLSAESALRSAPVDSWLVRRSREQEFNVVSKKVALETEASSSSSEQWRRASSVSCSSRRRHRRRSSRTDGGGGGGGSGRGSRSFDGASRAPVTQNCYTMDPTQRGKAASAESQGPPSPSFRFQHFKVREEEVEESSTSGAGRERKKVFFLKTGKSFKKLPVLIQYYMVHPLKERSGVPFLNESLMVQRSADDFFDNDLMMTTSCSSSSTILSPVPSAEEGEDGDRPSDIAAAACVPTDLEGPLWEDDDEAVVVEEERQQSPESSPPSSDEEKHEEVPEDNLPEREPEEEKVEKLPCQETAACETTNNDANQASAESDTAAATASVASWPQVLRSFSVLSPAEVSLGSRMASPGGGSSQLTDGRILAFELMSLAEEARKMKELAVCIEAKATRVLKRCHSLNVQLVEAQGFTSKGREKAEKQEEDTSLQTTPTVGTIFKVVRRYTPAYPDELELFEGDHVFFLQLIQNGWWKGQMEEGNKKVGIFPSNFVELATSRTKE